MFKCNFDKHSAPLPRSGYVSKPKVASTLGQYVQIIINPERVAPRDATALRLDRPPILLPRVAEAATLGCEPEPLCGKKFKSEGSEYSSNVLCCTSNLNARTSIRCTSKLNSRPSSFCPSYFFLRMCSFNQQRSITTSKPASEAR